MKLRWLLILFIFLQIGCDPNGNNVGPCVHIYEESVLHIQSVTDIQTGQPIDAIIIREALLDGQKQGVMLLKQDKSYNVVVYDTTLVCNVPCGFATQSGNYNLRVSAQGYRDTTVTVNANYSISKGGCPSSSNGGTRFSFQMQPQ